MQNLSNNLDSKLQDKIVFVYRTAPYIFEPSLIINFHTEPEIFYLKFGEGRIKDAAEFIYDAEKVGYRREIIDGKSCPCKLPDGRIVFPLTEFEVKQLKYVLEDESTYNFWKD